PRHTSRTSSMATSSRELAGSAASYRTGIGMSTSRWSYAFWATVQMPLILRPSTSYRYENRYWFKRPWCLTWRWWPSRVTSKPSRMSLRRDLNVYKHETVNAAGIRHKRMPITTDARAAYITDPSVTGSNRLTEGSLGR